MCAAECGGGGGECCRVGGVCEERRGGGSMGGGSSCSSRSSIAGSPSSRVSALSRTSASCQGTSETGNVSHPSAHRTPTDLWNGCSRGRIPAECLEQKMLYAYATVCTQGDFTLSRK